MVQYLEDEGEEFMDWVAFGTLSNFPRLLSFLNTYTMLDSSESNWKKFTTILESRENFSYSKYLSMYFSYMFSKYFPD